ncbi:hypothetical protein ACFYKX_10875 [Cytobacillus sp. FJAT-54145]|uniref:Uncharacterized protein n=1 Tax=Cytobacillus spartinae TaxID=3299023 RepID=A0ABW6KA52_9BACI
MKVITLAEALPLRGVISRRIQELIQERQSVAIVEVEKGETPEPCERTFEEVSLELEQVRKDFRTLDYWMQNFNVNTRIEWNGEDMTVTEALELAKQLRGEIQSLKSFGNRKKTERVSRGGILGQKTELLAIAQYDPKAIKQQAMKLERQVTRLSALIEKTNHTYTIPFDASCYMGEE